MAIAHPYLMFLGEAHDQLAAKTAQGIVHWRPDWCPGQLRLPGCKADLKIPDMTLEQAKAAGVKTVIVGVANRGGKIGGNWTETLVKALELGMDLASGLHRRLSDIPEVSEAARRLGRQLFDVRHPTREFEVGTGAKRPGKRLLAVGTDCSVGKMYTTLGAGAGDEGPQAEGGFPRHGTDRDLHRGRGSLHRRRGLRFRLRRR